MSAWQSRVDELLYEGETVKEQVGGKDVQIVVTSHRVLAFLPEEEGPDFRAVDLPNITGVSQQMIGSTTWLLRGMKWLVVGLILAVGGILADFEGIFIGGEFAESLSQVGLGGLLGLFAMLRTFVAIIDDILLLVGLAGVLGGLAVLGYYYYSTRRESVVIGVKGGDDIAVPAEELSGPAMSKIADAVEPR